MSNENQRLWRAAKRRRLVIGLAVATLLAAIGIACIPWIIAATPLRNTLVNRIIADPHLRANVGAASFGWFSPLKLGELTVRHVHDESQMRVARIEADRSWLQILISAPDLGTIEIDRPHVSLTLAKGLEDLGGAVPSGKDPTGKDPSGVKPTLTAVVTNGAFDVRVRGQSQPVIDLSKLNVTARIERADRGRLLIIDPVTVFDRESLTPELCRHGLQLVAPVLADATSVDGAISFELSTCRIPLDEIDEEKAAQVIEIRGSLGLHQVTASLRGAGIEAVLELLARILQAEIPPAIRIADETELAFEMREGRFYHEGLAFMLPEVSPDLVIRTRGTVGFDESLDLTVETKIPLTLVHDGPISRQLSEHPFTVHITGTLDEPKVELPDEKDWLDDLARVVLSKEPTQDEMPLAGAIVDVIGGLLENTGTNENATRTPILDLIRGRTGDRTGESSESAEDGSSPSTPILDRIRSRRQQRSRPPNDPGDTSSRPRPLRDRLRARRQGQSNQDAARVREQ